MWIIPNNLQLSNGAPDTEAFISDLNEQSQICASSLMVRSKPSPARTWSLKWRRDSWTRLLSGRILKPSQHKSFVTEWTCLWPVIPASHSAQQGNDSEQKTRVTSGHTSPDQFELFAPDSVSLRMSKDTSRWDSPASSATWKSWVTKCRGEYSARLKSAHLTNGSGSSSWATPTALLGSMYAEGNALERNSMSLASQASLTTWPTPIAKDWKGCGNAVQRKDGKHRLDTLEAVVMFGLHAPANPSTHGSRPESWRTPSSSDGEGGVMEMREGCAGKYKLRDHVVAEQKSWATPRANKVHPEITEDNRDHLANRNKSNLEEEIAGHCGKVTGKLNPRWVETLMGLPIGWTMPSCTRPMIIAPMNCDCLETESSQPPQNERLEFF